MMASIRVGTRRALALLSACVLLSVPLAQAASKLTPAEAHVIGKEAYIYGYPLVANYRSMFEQAVRRGGPQFLAPFNQLAHGPHAPAQASPMANLDLSHSFAWLDLRAEPMVLTLPAVEPDRYLSVQLVDLYAHNFAYLGRRTAANGAGNFLIAGPVWKGALPPGVAKVVQAETPIALALIRMQRLAPADAAAVRRIQAGVRLQPLSSFLGKPPPKAAPKLDFPTPAADMLTAPAFFDYLAFVLRLCPIHPTEQDMRERFARVGLEQDKPFRIQALPPELRDAFAAGMKDAAVQLDALRTRRIDPARLFGARERFAGDYSLRAAGAIAGLYGDSPEEALYPLYFEDEQGAALDAAQRRYTLRFGPGQLPPVNGFWSLTLYELPSQALAPDPLGRHRIHSRGLSDLRFDGVGGVTIAIQADSPGPARDSNWLPAPEGPFLLSLRLYWPKESAVAGEWKPPPVERTR